MKIRQVIIFTFIVSYAFSQELSYQKYTVAEGLPQSQAMQIHQDGKGYLWICTKNGLSQFDGVEFTNYTVKEGLPDGFVKTIHIDKNDTIWAISRAGISKFLGDRFLHYPYEDKQNKYRAGVFLDEYNDSLWLFRYLDDKTFLTSFKDGKYSNTELPDYGRLKGLTTSLNNDTLLVIYSDGYYSYTNGKFKRVNTKGKLKRFDRYKILRSTKDSLSILKEQDKLILNGIPNQLLNAVNQVYENNHLYLIGENNASRLLWEKEYPYYPLKDRSGTLWIPSEGGLYKYSSEAFLNFKPEHGLNKNIWSIVEDKKGNYWFASFTNGLQVYDGDTFRDRNEIFKVRDEPLYLGAKCLSNGHILFPSNTGVIRWDGKTFSDVEWARGQTEIVYENPETNELLIGSVDGLIYKKGNKIKQFKELSAARSGYVMGISHDTKGFYWFMTDKTIVRFEGEQVYYFNEDDVPLRTGITTDVDSLGNIWMGGYEGLFYYNYSDKRFTSALPVDEMEMIKFVKVMDKNRLLIGRTKDLLIVYLDKYFNQEPNYFRIVDKKDGYIGIEPKQNGVLKDSKGYYWINASNGVIRFDDSKLKIDKQTPFLHIKSVNVLQEDNSWILKQKIKQSIKPYVDTVKTNYKENSLRINYTGISTKCPEGVKYKYRLIGHDSNWTKPDEKRYAEFQQLQPGKYTFEVLASNIDNYWNAIPERLIIIIKPAFWQTLAFKSMLYLFVVIFICGAVYLYFRRREIRNRRKEKQQADYTHMQISQLIKQFDPHFTFNVVSVIGGHILSGEKERAYDYLLNLSELLRVALNDHGVFTKTIHEEIAFLQNYCETQQLVIGDKLTYEIEVDESVDMQARVPKMLIQNFVENSIKHGISHRKNGGRVNVKLVQSSTHIIATIEDDGIGRIAARKLSSNGTHKGHQITNELFSLINKVSKNKIKYEIIDLYNENGDPNGTKVIIYMPSSIDL